MKTILLFGLLGLSTQTDPFLGESQKSGLVTFDNGDDMFYWMFRSRREAGSDPLVMWLTGGPGCASETALFYENGPFSINDDLSLKYNSNSWNDVANVVYVDQPVGTGFSQCEKLKDHNTNEEEIAATMGLFLEGFLEQNPEFIGRDFYVTGESYAGHYIPAISYYIINNMTNFQMKFKGMAIGNGWVDPYLQYPAYADFAYENGLIGQVEYNMLTVGFKGCQKLINSRFDIVALEACQLLTEVILGNPLKPRFNVYDIRDTCDDPPLCYDFSNSDKYLAQPDILEELGVSGRKWVECDTAVHMFLLGDWMTNLASKVADIANKGYSVLIYSGDKDFICNWRGGEAWTSALDWNGKDQFNAAGYKEWSVNGQPAGQLKAYQNFKFLRVYDAGHMVPMDQPVVALQMLQAFITNELQMEEVQ